MMKYSLFVYFIFLIFYSNSSFCQSFEKLKLYDNSLNKSKLDSNFTWNPLQVGNKWQFIDCEGKLYTKEVFYDTLINNRLYYFVSGGLKANSYFERNNENLTYLYDIDNLDEDSTTQELLLENFNTSIDSFFYSYRYKFLTGDSLKFKIIDRFWAYVYLYDDTVKALTYEVWSGDEWIESTDTWVQKYGVVLMEGEGNTLFLSGAVVDSVQYGEIVKIEEKLRIKIPENIRLLGNYPNPFNNRTIIEIECSKPVTLKFSVYNISGKLIISKNFATPVQGKTKIIFDSSGSFSNVLASGIYIYVINSPYQQLTGKMLLIK